MRSLQRRLTVTSWLINAFPLEVARLVTLLATPDSSSTLSDPDLPIIYLIYTSRPEFASLQQVSH